MRCLEPRCVQPAVELGTVPFQSICLSWVTLRLSELLGVKISKNGIFLLFGSGILPMLLGFLWLGKPTLHHRPQMRVNYSIANQMGIALYKK
jgi:hypothetical protein